MLYLSDKKKCSLVVLAVAALSVCLPVVVCAQSATKTLSVVGTGVVRGDRVETARNSAISNSLDLAVRQVTVSEIPQETLLKNFQLINRLIQDKTDTFIQDYKVLTETRSGQIYSVLVQATVSLVTLEEQFLSAGIMFGRKALPKILFLIAEKNHRDMPPQYWWGQTVAVYKGFAETTMAKAMNQKGFNIIDPVAMTAAVDLNMDLNKPDLTNQEAMAFGNFFQADVVVIGRSIVHQTLNTMGPNTRSFQGMVTARAVRLDSGEEIATSMRAAVSVNADEVAGGQEALFKAGAQAGEDLASQILAVWYREVNQPTLVEVIIEGSSNLVYFERFRRALMEVSGVRGLHIKEMKPDDVRLVVDFEGSAEKLASALMLNVYDAFGINISEISQNHLKIQLVPG